MEARMCFNMGWRILFHELFRFWYV